VYCSNKRIRVRSRDSDRIRNSFRLQNAINCTVSHSNFFPAAYLIVILISYHSQLSGAIVAYVPYVSHLTFVTITNPLYLLHTVILDSVHLLSIVFPQLFELLAFILLNVVEHLVDLLSSWRHTYAPAA